MADRTKLWISDSLKRLMASKPLERIRVTDVCREAGIGLTVVPPVCLPDGTLVSSSAVRDCLFHNDRRQAEEMLNRPLSPREEALLGGRNDE